MACAVRACQAAQIGGGTRWHTAFDGWAFFAPQEAEVWWQKTDETRSAPVLTFTFSQVSRGRPEDAYFSRASVRLRHFKRPFFPERSGPRTTTAFTI